MDPSSEKKPWLTPYHYVSNNPMNKIDPDGRDDIFTEKGIYSHSTETGSNILIKTPNGLRYPSSFKTNWNVFSPKGNARDILKNVYSYYANKIGRGSEFRGITALRETGK